MSRRPDLRGLSRSERIWESACDWLIFVCCVAAIGIFLMFAAQMIGGAT